MFREGGRRREIGGERIELESELSDDERQRLHFLVESDGSKVRGVRNGGFLRTIRSIICRHDDTTPYAKLTVRHQRCEKCM